MGDQRWAHGFEGPLDEIIDVEPPPRERHAAGTPVQPKGRGGARWRPLSLVAAALLAGAVVIALTDFRSAPQAGPSATTSQTMPEASVTSISEGPTIGAGVLGPNWQSQVGLSAVIIPSELMRTIPEGAGQTPVAGRTERGPFAYASGGPDGNAVEVRDYGLGTIALFGLPLRTGEQLVSVNFDGDWLAVMVARSDRSCGQTMPWRLLTAKLGPDGLPVGGFEGLTVLAKGEGPVFKVPGEDCKTSKRPEAALGGGNLAWVEDNGDGGLTQIRVVALATGREVKFDLARHAVEIAVSADAVAWVESSDIWAWQHQMSGQPSPVKNWRVMRGSLVGDGVRDYNSGHEVDIGQTSGPDHPNLPYLVLDGAAIVATRFDGDMTTPDVKTSVVRSADDGMRLIDDGQDGRSCFGLSASDGMVALYCLYPGITRDDGAGGNLVLAAVWTPGDGLRALGLDSAELPPQWFPFTEPGWLLLEGQGGWSAVPMSAIATS